MFIIKIRTAITTTTSSDEDILGKRSLVYNLFIAIVTLYSLIIMAFQVLPVLGASTRSLFYIDLALSIIFLSDFLTTLYLVKSRRRYFFNELGFLDLIGSLPFFPLFRLGRIPRLIRIVRYIRGKHQMITIMREIRRDPAKSALLGTLFSSIVLITIVSILVLQAESYSPEANIIDGGDAVWWSFVTVTTVGYGDYYPVTAVGRILGVILMLFGVGIFGVLTTYFSSAFLRRSIFDRELKQAYTDTKIEELPQELIDTAVQESALSKLDQIRAEMAALRSENEDLKAQINRLIALVENLQPQS